MGESIENAESPAGPAVWQLHRQVTVFGRIGPRYATTRVRAVQARIADDKVVGKLYLDAGFHLIPAA